MGLDHRSAEWFHEQAERCERLAVNLGDNETAERLRRLAEEYAQEAKLLAAIANGDASSGEKR
jgi:hypothetical protein